MRAYFLPVTILLILAWVAVILWNMAPVTSRGAPPPPGAARASMEIGGEFNLVNQHGQPVHSRDFDGRFRLVYFGYTFCPDICPNDMLVMSQILDAFEGDANAPAAIFISVDPERDTVEHLHRVMQNFHPDMLALTGDQAAIDEAKRAFKVYSAKSRPDGTMAEYLVDHSTFMYLVAPDGSYVSHFNHGTDAETILKHIHRAMAEQFKPSRNQPKPTNEESPNPTETPTLGS